MTPTVYVPPAITPNWRRFAGYSALGPLSPGPMALVIDTAALVQALKAFKSNGLK